MGEEFEADNSSFLKVNRNLIGVGEARLRLTEQEEYHRQHKQDRRQGDMHEGRETEERGRSLS